MRRKQFTERQILSILKQHESGVSVADLCREHGMSQSAFYKLRSKYAGMDSSRLNELKRLQEENAKLKKLYAEERLVSEARKELLEGKW